MLRRRKLLYLIQIVHGNNLPPIPIASNKFSTEQRKFNHTINKWNKDVMNHNGPQKHIWITQIKDLHNNNKFITYNTRKQEMSYNKKGQYHTIKPLQFRFRQNVLIMFSIAWELLNPKAEKIILACHYCQSIVNFQNDSHNKLDRYVTFWSEQQYLLSID